jgi:hypothetical protein
LIQLNHCRGKTGHSCIWFAMSRRKEMSRWPFLLFAGGLFALAALASCALPSDKPTAQRVPYSTFQKYLDTNQVGEASVGPDEIEATLRNGTTIVTTRVSPDIAAELERRGVVFSGKAGLEGD